MGAPGGSELGDHEADHRGHQGEVGGDQSTSHLDHRALEGAELIAQLAIALAHLRPQVADLAFDPAGALLDLAFDSVEAIVLTAMEHHSNIVPWQQLAERVGAAWRARRPPGRRGAARANGAA